MEDLKNWFHLTKVDYRNRNGERDRVCRIKTEKLIPEPFLKIRFNDFEKNIDLQN